jgi:hypothetical protein
MPLWDPPSRWKSRHRSDDPTLDTVHKVNDEIQDWVSNNGKDLPTDLIKLLSDLDWALNGK